MLGPSDTASALQDAWRFRALCVTGTNGKTTTTAMIAAIIAAAGEPAAFSSTVGAWVGGRAIDLPRRERLLPFLAAAAEAGARSIAVEVVSLALATGFARTCPPDVAVFTNLMEDHYKLHGSREGYLAAKAKLFTNLRPHGAAVLNAVDPESRAMANAAPAGTALLAYATGEVATANAALPLALQARKVSAAVDGMHVSLAPSALGEALGGALALKVTGAHNASNALAAAVAAHAAGFPAAAIERGLASFAGVPGRFQIVATQPLVIVDFAHTPDALRTVLVAARELGARGQLTCVFGCGGDRNRERRTPLGRVAGALADRVIITTDNPRSEDPLEIAADVERGLREASSGSFVRELDRRTAIEAAIRAARPEDVVLIAGKGHETTQEVRGRELPWSDVEVARGVLEPALREHAKPSARSEIGKRPADPHWRGSTDAGT
ncbi:MAG: UDP-N-acetylmuramyl-tripeptide synthetase [Myxococcales bacterium]|nr:MAG: UDP-N-acetylmuramyl-tripeptide synthetase [Myxococcales bacterium]